MPEVNNVSFNVRFNLQGAPTLMLTDSTSSPPTGLVGIFSITQPDGYTRTGDINNPDITAAGGTFSISLRLSSTGGIQCGEYTIKYTVVAEGYDDTDFTRMFIMNYNAVDINIVPEFDVFTPRLVCVDATVYQAPGFDMSGLVRSWAAVSQPTGVIGGSGVELDLAFNGRYYDASYNITLSSSMTYTSQTYPWLVITETVSKSITKYAQTPPTINQIVSDISALKLAYDNAVNSCSEEDSLREQFKFAQALFSHIIDKLKTEDLDNIYVDINDLIVILNNNQIPPYVATNTVINQYDVSSYFTSAVWGDILGDISNQTDLWNILSDLYNRDNFEFNQSVPTVSWTIIHNMGKNPSVTTIDNSGNSIEGNIQYDSVNQITIYFSQPVSGKAYLN